MFSITTSELPSTISILRNAKKPLLILGTYGIGKSEMIFQSAVADAEAKGRKFIDWNRSSNAEKAEAMKDPSSYYIFVDIRISQLDEGDLRGIPVIGTVDAAKDNELKLVTLGWINYITKAGAAGTVFFDELNLARPSVTASAYSIINDKVISDRSISPEVFIVAAGNNTEDCDLVQPIAEPLMDRFAMAQLILDKKYWLEWAAKNINPYLYAFCNWDSSMIHKPAKAGSEDKAITPRGIYNASCILDNVDFSNKREVHKAIAICVGEAFATKFLAYYEHVRAIDWSSLKEDPSCVANFDTEKQFAVMGAAVAKIKEVAESTSSSAVDFLSSTKLFLQVLANLPTDFIMAAIKQLVALKPNYGSAKVDDAQLSIANLIGKIMLMGAKAFNTKKKLPASDLATLESLQAWFKPHVKIFTRL